MEKIIIDHGKAFDFGKTSKEYARYRDIYPDIVYEKLREIGVGRAGSKWLDIGTGTGVVPRNLAVDGADITAVDISEEQIEEAIVLSKQFANIHYEVCSAENLQYDADTFDAVTACQCFWYFDPNIIVPMLKNIIKPNGLFVKLYMSYVKEDPIASVSHRMVKEINRSWVGGASAVQDLRMHYFDDPQMETIISDIPFTRAHWHGRMLASRGVEASMSKAELELFKERHWAFMLQQPENFFIRHKIFITYYRMKKC